MGKVIWSPAALDDVDAIAEFIARDSVHRAALFAERLTEASERLIDFPMSGRIIPEIDNPNAREIIYGAYRIMYKIAGDEVWVTSVIHGARDFNQ